MEPTKKLLTHYFFKAFFCTILRRFTVNSQLPFTLFICLSILATASVSGQFVHPGGLHKISDLDRMKQKVSENAHPWIDDWNKLIQDPRAQNTYNAAATGNMGSSRQRADADAHAAYLNTIRWYISGDTTYAACAVRICNAWANAVNQVPSGTDIPGLSGIPIFDFALAAEVLRIYPGWDSADFNKFKNMMVTYWYPVCHDFLANHRGSCISHYWANWDIANTGALIAMGVLCDDTAKFNEGVSYFKEGGGSGNINNAVYHLYSPVLGQWQESGRDQEHAQLGVGMMAYYCQVAWNQGIDLFGYENNKLLAGAEYVARTNLSLPVPYTAYNNCDNVHQKWLSSNGLGRIDDRPVWELLYNHYVVRQGLSAPNIQAMANITRPEVGSTDHLGYGTLTFTLDQSASGILTAVPSAPAGVTATAGIGSVALNWNAADPSNVQGWSVLRSTASGGPYETIASWTRNTYPRYVDNTVSDDTTYYYVIKASNQAGSGVSSAEVSAIPRAATAALPPGWTVQNIACTYAGGATYAPVTDNAFIMNGAGQLGGLTDQIGGYTYGYVKGDFSFSARLMNMGGSQTGLMARESLDPAARTYVMKLGDTGWREGGYGSRSSQGANMKWVMGNDYTWVPAWFKIERAGDSIVGYESGDGNTWFKVSGDTITADGLYVGFLVTSGSVTVSNVSGFDHVNMTVQAASVPNAPTGLLAVPGNTADSLQWAATEGSSSYSVLRAEKSGGPYELIAGNLNATQYVDTGLVNGTTYYYVIKAASLNGESQYSAEATAAPRLAIPPVPDSLRAFSISLHRIDVSWRPSLTATDYYIKRAVSPGGPYTIIDTVQTTNYKDTASLDSALIYYYVVSAANRIGASPNSAEVKAIAGKYAYYNFNEPDSMGSSVLDSWGGHTGMLQPGVKRASGYHGNGISLDGTANAYVSLPAGFVNQLTDFTISTWVKPAAISTWQRIFDFGSGTNNYMFLTMSSGSTLRYAIKNGGAEQVVNSSGLLSAGVWHHVAVTQSGTVATMYVDGVQVGQNTHLSLTPSDLPLTTQNYIGKSQFNDPILNGSVDEFRMYSRALDITEIEAEVPPMAPAGLSVTGGNNISTLNWTAAARATGYTVRRSDGNDSLFVPLAQVSGTSYIDTSASNCVVHYYEVTAVNNVGEGAPSTAASAYLGSQLAGTLIGTDGSWNNNAATTKSAAVDGNVNTFFDASTGSGAWVGYDLGSDSAVIRQVKYAPRSGYASRMSGGKFQGAHNADFSDAVDLFTVTGSPAVGSLTTQTIGDQEGYRYVRYLGPDNANCDVAEVQFFGLPARLPALTSATTLAGEADRDFSYSIEASGLASGFTASGLPAGIHIDGCTGIISGNTTAQGSFIIPITITNYFGIAEDTLHLAIAIDSALAVNWSYFRADPKEKSVQLRWSAAAGFNMQSFGIERSQDAKSYVQIGRMAVHGTSGALNKYTYMDIPSAGGVYYYRLHVLGQNGSSRYSKVVTVTLGTPGSQAVAYPNPARNYVFVPGSAETRVSLYDMSGNAYRVAASPVSGGKIRISLQEVPAGNYLLKVTNDNGAYVNYKISVLH